MRRRPSRSAARPGARRIRSIVALAACAVLLAPAGAFAQTFLPEVQVTTAAIPDYEFDWGRDGVFCRTCNFGTTNARLAFTDHDGRLWVGQVDYATGDFIPPDGHGVLIDTNTPPVPDFGNGPEWMASASGSQLVYTRYLDDVAHSEASAQIAIATQTAAGWSTAILPGSLGRATPDGTKDPNDPDPRLNYIEANKTALFWRKMSAPGVEVVMPISDLTGGNSRRWVPGTRKVIFQGHNVADPRLLDQIYTFDTDADLPAEKLTFDSVTKAGGFMWRAPEYNNEYLFFTMANFRKEIWVYRNLAGPGGKRYWTVTKKIKAPKLLPFFWSPEVFTHNGRSYIFTQVSPDAKFFDKGVPTHLALTGIDPLRSDFRMLTNDSSKPRVRLDPEYFITAQGPFIYYNRLVPATEQYPDGINDGVWRVDTKLGPPKF